MFRAETPQLYIDIDRTKCEVNYVAMDDVFNTLQVNMGGMFVNLFNKFGRTWQVNLMADHQFRTDPEALKQLKVRNKLGGMVPLSTLATIENRAGPVMVNRYNLYPSAGINGAAAAGVSSSESIAAVDQLANGLAFGGAVLVDLQVEVVHDLANAPDRRVSETDTGHQHLERAQRPLMAELDAEHVEGHLRLTNAAGVLGEPERRVRVDVSADQPGAGHSIDARARPRHPDPLLVCTRIQGRQRRRTDRRRRDDGATHLLLEPFQGGSDLLPSGRSKEIDRLKLV
jgi:hypothetical protein